MIPIDEEILAGHILEGEAIWENEEASKFATGDWLAATADELSEETGVPRQRVVNSLLGKCAFHWRSGHYKTLQARELVSRRWPLGRREQLPNLSYTHYRRIGDNEELAQKANEGMWSVQQIEEYKQKEPMQDNKLLSWFSGFFDADGSLGVYFNNASSDISAYITGRIDERGLFEEIKENLGIGKIRERSTIQTSHSNMRMVNLDFSSGDYACLIKIFEKFPLRTHKKKMQYSLWKEAVAIQRNKQGQRRNYTAEEIQRMHEISEEITSISKGIKELVIEYDGLRHRIKDNGVPKAEWYERKEEIYKSLLEWAKG